MNWKENLRLEWKHFFSCHIIAGIYFSCIILVLVQAILSIFQGFTTFEILYSMIRIQFFFLTLFVGIMFLYFSKAKEQNTEEVLLSIFIGRPVYRIYKFCFAFLLLVGIFLEQLLILVINAKVSGTDPYFFSIFSSNFIYNIIFPSIICLETVFLISGIRSRVKAYGMLITFLFLISPMGETFIWRVKPSFPIDQIIFYLRWPFTFLYQNASWSPNIQYGLQIEENRVVLEIAWLIFLSSIIIRNLRKTILEKRKQIVNSLIMKSGIIVSIILLSISMMPSSYYRINKKWDGYYSDFNFQASDWRFADVFSTKHLEQPNYEISSYNMDIELGKQLKVSGNLEVKNPENREQIIFTLYHGYNVSKWEIEEGIAYNWKQEGDYLILNLDTAVSNFIISFSYEGKHDVFYSNSRGAMLPGFFPWYPMAGKKQIAVSYIDYTYGYNSYNRVKEANFDININTVEEIITNLDKLSDGHYMGITDGLSLFTGYLLPIENSNVKSYLPLEISYVYSKDEFIQNYIQSIDKTQRILQEVYGIDSSFLQGKPIIYVSKDLARNFTNQEISIFNDYILSCQKRIYSNNILKNLLLKNGKTSILTECALLLGECLSASEVVESLYQLCDWRIREEQNENQEVYIQLRSKIEEAVQKVGTEVFVKNMYQYLLYDTTRSDEQFFAQIEN